MQKGNKGKRVFPAPGKSPPDIQIESIFFGQHIYDPIERIVMMDGDTPANVL